VISRPSARDPPSATKRVVDCNLTVLPEPELFGRDLFPPCSPMGSTVQRSMLMLSQHIWRVACLTRRRVEVQGVLLPYPHPIYSYLFQNINIFYSRSKHRKNKKKTISSSRRFSIPRFAPSLCRYDAAYRRLGATYLSQENTEEEIVFVEFPSRFSRVLAEKEVWVDDVIGRKCTTPTLRGAGNQLQTAAPRKKTIVGLSEGQH
jgi:hypothetical protein